MLGGTLILPFLIHVILAKRKLDDRGLVEMFAYEFLRFYLIIHYGNSIYVKELHFERANKLLSDRSFTTRHSGQRY